MTEPSDGPAAREQQNGHTDLYPSTPTAAETDADPMLAVYRHDTHKLLLRSHRAARETYGGVRVNEQVPLGADRDAALLSRPRGNPDQTTNHQSPLRISLVTGTRDASEAETNREIEQAVRDLVTIEEPERMHAAWLESSVATRCNEAMQFPYTSLKYHTLLAGALYANYCAGHAFADLWLVVNEHDKVVPHRTILQAAECSLRLTATPGDRPATPLGDTPARSWADVWSRLPEHPLPDTRHGRILDAQLRRIRSWSTALQYLEEYQETARRLGVTG